MSVSIRTAIARMLSILPEGCELYGIGSFFEGQETFRDVDLVVVTSDSSKPARSTKAFRQAAAKTGQELSVTFDITVFTEPEFAAKPLRDMGKLVLLART